MIFKPATVSVDFATFLTGKRVTNVWTADTLLSVGTPLVVFSVLKGAENSRNALCNLSRVLARYQVPRVLHVFRAILDQQLHGSRGNAAAYNSFSWWWARLGSLRRIIIVLSKHALACQQIDSLVFQGVGLYRRSTCFGESRLE